MKEELSAYEKKIFSQLKKEEMPSPELEKRLIRQLKSENLIKNTLTMNTYLKWAASIAAAVLIFFVGNMVGKRSSVISIDPNLGYMLILHEDEKFQPGEPYEMFREYAQWMNNTFEKGISITGQELKNEATWIDAEKNVEHLTASATNKVTGYFVLEARSLEEALEVAKNNPHIKYGGSIEVKQYMVR